MIIKGIIKWLVLGGVILLLPYFVPGVMVENTTTALIAAAVIGLINVFIKPILKIITLPLTLLTLGLFGFLLNVLLLWIASLFVPGFEITTFTGGVIASVILAVGLWILHRILKV